MMKAAKKTETVSYRIRSDLKSALEEEGRRLGINSNALVSQILTRHIDWGRFTGRLNFIPVSKDFLRLIFDSLSREQIEKTARSLGETAAHEEILFLFTRINLVTVLQFLKLWASHFDASDYRYEGGKHVYTVKHEVNLNYSYFTKEYLSSLLRSSIGTNVTFEAMTPNSVTFAFADSQTKISSETLPTIRVPQPRKPRPDSHDRLSVMLVERIWTCL
jgi:hypothetical protein